MEALLKGSYCCPVSSAAALVIIGPCLASIGILERIILMVLSVVSLPVEWTPESWLKGLPFLPALEEEEEEEEEEGPAQEKNNITLSDIPFYKNSFYPSKCNCGSTKPFFLLQHLTAPDPIAVPWTTLWSAGASP